MKRERFQQIDWIFKFADFLELERRFCKFQFASSSPGAKRRHCDARLSEPLDNCNFRQCR